MSQAVRGQVFKSSSRGVSKSRQMLRNRKLNRPPHRQAWLKSSYLNVVVVEGLQAWCVCVFPGGSTQIRVVPTAWLGPSLRRILGIPADGSESGNNYAASREDTTLTMLVCRNVVAHRSISQERERQKGRKEHSRLRIHGLGCAIQDRLLPAASLLFSLPVTRVTCRRMTLCDFESLTQIYL
jgi:hypothetical protein